LTLRGDEYFAPSAKQRLRANHPAGSNMMAPFQLLAVLAQQQDFGNGQFNNEQAEAVGGAIGMVCNCFALILVVIVVISMWKLFVKAGKPGWAAIIPIYNTVVLLEIVGRPIWWIILLLIPCVSIVVSIIVCIDLAKSFGKGTGFGVGLALLGFIFFPILGFGDSRYLGPSVPQPGAPQM
jgi:hypothetical protein